MPRALTGAADNALKANHVPMLVFAELDFASGFVRVTNAAYDFNWNGFTWTGVGNLGSIEAVKEGAELQMYGIGLRLSGIPSELVSIALGEHYQGRSAKIWLAPLTSDYQIIADPILLWSGRMDTMQIEMGDTASITVTAESRLVDWERPRIRRYNHEDQIGEYSTDKGLEFVTQATEKEVVWGVTSSNESVMSKAAAKIRGS